MKIVRAPLPVLALVLLLSACGQQPPPAAWPDGAPPRNEAIASAPITLRVWLAADYAEQPPIADLVRDFRQAYPNIKVEVTGYVWEAMASEVRLAISQGSPPDVAHQHAFAMGAQGMAEPLDDLWARWGAEGEFMPGAMDDVLWRGVRYGVPLDINALFMIYNRAAFAEVGLREPGPGYTFAQLRSDLERLTTEDRARYGIALTASGWDMYGLVRSNGGELLREDDARPSVTIDDSAVIETVQFMSALARDRLGTLPPPQPRQSDHPVTLFGQRKVALFFSGPWDLTRLKNEAPPDVYAEVGTAPLPVSAPGAAGSSVQGGGSLFVPKGAANREAAFELMKWAVSDRYAMRMAKEMGRYPVRSALYDDPFFGSEPLLQPFLEQLKTARPYKLEAYASAHEAWSTAVRQSFTPGVDVGVILREAQRRAEAAVEKSP